MGVAQGKKEKGKTLLVVGAAGGVGSMLVQLARVLTALTVIGTGARPESAEWARKMGAQHIIDHKKAFKDELASIGIAQVDYIASLTHTSTHFPAYAQVIAPFGRLGMIDTPGALDITLLKPKSASLHWEYMFARPLYQSADMQVQHDILNSVADLVDAGKLRSSMNANFGKINAENIRKAHAQQESGITIGKIVLEGF
jgi:zinc-binding alcohol dehydrogenase family protein